MLLTKLEDIEARLAGAETIAVLGAHEVRWRPAFYVPDYLFKKGYRILPVNPHLAGKRLFDEVVVARLADLELPCDMIDIFRRSDALPDHLDEILALDPRPKTVWIQSGIINPRFSKSLVAAGLDVIEDRCTYADHKLFRLPPKGRAA